MNDEEYNQIIESSWRAVDALDEIEIHREFGDLRCNLFDTESRDWYDADNSGVRSRDNAQIMTVRDAAALLTNGQTWPPTLIVILNTPPPQPQAEAAPPPPPVEGAGKFLLTSKQLKMRPDIHLKQGYLIEHHEYWREPVGTGYTTKRDEAARVTVGSALTFATWSYFDMVDQELAEKLSKLKCSMLAVLGPSLSKLLEIAPLNPTARAQVMATIGQMPPKELDTFPKLRDWIETTYDPQTRKSPSLESPQGAGPLVVEVTFRDVEIGTCSYRANRYARRNMTIPPEAIQNLVDANHPRGFQGLFDQAYDYITENAWGLNPTMEWVSGAEHFDYSREGTDEDESSVEPRSGAVFSDQLKDYLRRTQPREVLRRLGIAM